jgi:anti-anti-sigma factor
MEIIMEKLDDRLVFFVVSGRVDALTSPQLEKELVPALADQGMICVLDLTQVDYMSSAGLRVLLICKKTAARNKGTFALCGMQEAVRNILEMVGYLPLLEIYPDRSAAHDAASRKRLEG